MTTTLERRVAAALRVLGAGRPRGEEADRGDDPPAASPPVAGGDVAELRTQMQAMREHLSAFGSAIGALATAVLAGVGWAAMQKLVPLPPGALGSWLAVLAGAFATAAVCGAVLLTRSFFAAGRRIVIDTDTIPDEGEDLVNRLSAAEVTAAQLVLRDVAAEEAASGVKALELRAWRLARASRAAVGLADDGQAQRLAAESERLIARLDSAAVWACVKILEVRSIAVFRGARTAVLALTVAVSIVGLLVVSNVAQHHTLVAGDVLACGKALATGEAPSGATCTSDGRLVLPPSASAGAGGGPTGDPAALRRLAECREATDLPVGDPLVQVALAQCAGLPAATE